MRLAFMIAAMLALAPLSACQSTGEDGESAAYSKSNANRAKTDDPIAALKKY